jgi:5-methylthioadenosine/S-adenosylhomocysteine deaminase
MNNYILKVKYVLKNNNQLIEDAEIEIMGSKITYIGKKRQKNENDEEFQHLEYPQGFIMPAFVNGHTHLPETLIRGICDDEDLHTWLFNHVWKVEPSMTAQQAKIGALLGIAEMVKSGTIAFLDQYFYSQEIAEAVAETGIKAFLAPSIFDGNPETKTIEKAFGKNKTIFDKWNGYENRIFIGFGPHAPYSVSKTWFDEIIAETIERKTKIHTHVSETVKEVMSAKKDFGCSPVEYLHKMKGLEHILAAHCIITDEKDKLLLKQNGTTILTNPQSNMKIGAGIAPIPEYLKENINIVLGTDGSASNNNLDMMEEIRLLSLIHKGLQKNPKILPIKELIPLFTSNAKNIFPKNSYTGILEKNNPADLVIFDMNTVNNTPIINPVSNFMFSSNPSDVILTMANGKIIYEKQENKEIFYTLNINKVKHDAQKAIETMMKESNYTIKSEFE